MSDLKHTQRGFAYIEFQDRYDHKCSVQKSSLATEDAIWFGIDDANPQVLHGDAHRLGIETDATSGWVPYPLPAEVSLATRMHLTQDQVRELLPTLIHFAETGDVLAPADCRTQPEATAPAQDLSAAILAIPLPEPEIHEDGVWHLEYFTASQIRDMLKAAAALASSANALSAGDSDAMKRRAIAEANFRIGSWLSAALDDDNVCAEFKDDIRAWMSVAPVREPVEEAVVCPTCNGHGSVGHPPDDYWPCPDCCPGALK